MSFLHTNAVLNRDCFKIWTVCDWWAKLRHHSTPLKKSYISKAPFVYHVKQDITVLLLCNLVIFSSIVLNRIARSIPHNLLKISGGDDDCIVINCPKDDGVTPSLNCRGIFLRVRADIQLKYWNKHLRKRQKMLMYYLCEY